MEVNSFFSASLPDSVELVGIQVQTLNRWCLRSSYGLTFNEE